MKMERFKVRLIELSIMYLRAVFSFQNALLRKFGGNLERLAVFLGGYGSIGDIPNGWLRPDRGLKG